MTMLLPPFNAYLAALLAAKVAGHYIPEIEDCYVRYDNFTTPRALPLDFGH